MPDDSNGIYNVPPGTLVNTGDTVLPSQHNPWALDSSQAISNRFSKDGRSPATGDWDINNFRLKQVGNPTASGDGANKSYVDTQIAAVNQNAEKISTQSGNYTALLADKATSFRFTASATLALTAAATLGSNWWCEVWATNGNVTIDPNGAEIINGSATLVVQTGQSAKLFCTGTQFFAWVFSDSLSGPQLQGYYLGLGLTNNVTDAANDVNISVGSAATDTSPYALMQLNTELTKRIDAIWAAGNNQGGLDTGTVSASATYYIWIIQRSDSLVTDALFSLSSSAPTLPTGYDRKRLIGSLVRTGSVNGNAGQALKNTLSQRNPAITPGGTAFTIAGIPAAVQRVRVKLSGIQIASNGQIVVRVGTSAGIETSAGMYFSKAVGFAGTSLAESSLTTGFLLNDGSVGPAITLPNYGILDLQRHAPGSSSWELSGTMTRGNSGQNIFVGGATLLDELTQIQFTTTAGSIAFSGNNSVAIEWEF